MQPANVLTATHGHDFPERARDSVLRAPQRHRDQLAAPAD